MQDPNSYAVMREYARYMVTLTLPVPACLEVQAVSLYSKREAYALACAIMAMADDIYPKETV